MSTDLHDGSSSGAPSNLQPANEANNDQACDCGEAYRNQYKANEQQRRDDEEKAWPEIAKRLIEHDKTIAHAWKEEIDTLLVFAGLFSAVLTAFNVEVYTTLRPDPGVDLTNQILLQVLAQLNGSSAPSTPIPLQIAGTPSSSSVYINALWFSSLVLSLAAASIAIIVRQWLNHFVSPTASDNRRAAQIHCLRYKFGLSRWHVEKILSTLPILLLLALVLFFVGLLILLWNLNNVVAAITSGIVSALFIFFIFTTITPAIRHDCAYKSPQALLTLWLVDAVLVPIIYGTRAIVTWIRIEIRHAYGRSQILHRLGLRGPNNRPLPLQGSISMRAITVIRSYTRRHRSYDSWRTLELAILGDGTEPVNNHRELRTSVLESVLSCADATLSDDSFFFKVIHPCALGPEYSRTDAKIVIKAMGRTDNSKNYYATRCTSVTILSVAGRIAAYKEKWHNDIFSDKDIRHIAHYVRPGNDARAAFEIFANLYSRAQTQSDSTKILWILSGLLPKLIAPRAVVNKGLRLAHGDTRRLLKHACQELGTDSDRNPRFEADFCSAVWLICASIPEECYRWVGDCEETH